MILEVAGELTRPMATDFYGQVEGQRPVQCEGLIIDLSQVSFVDSAGIGVCVRLLQEVRRLERRGAIVIPADGTMDSVVALANLHRVAPVFRSQIEAIRCLASAPASTQMPIQVAIK